jgi:hypothetical protein
METDKSVDEISKLLLMYTATRKLGKCQTRKQIFQFSPSTDSSRKTSMPAPQKFQRKPKNNSITIVEQLNIPDLNEQQVKLIPVDFSYDYIFMKLMEPAEGESQNLTEMSEMPSS